MANPDPIRLTDAEKTKAARAKMIIWGVMALLLAGPLLIYWLVHRRE